MWTGTHNDYTSKATQIHIIFLTFSLPIFNYLISLKTFSIFALSAKNNNIKKTSSNEAIFSQTGSTIEGCFLFGKSFYGIKGIVGGVRPSVSVTYFCAFAASRSENVCASSVSVLTRAMALLNSSIALSKFPLE